MTEFEDKLAITDLIARYPDIVDGRAVYLMAVDPQGGRDHSTNLRGDRDRQRDNRDRGRRD